MRKHILLSEGEEIKGIRVRGLEVTRLEGLTDAVIGFAITLLIVSMEVPNTFEQLFSMVLGFPAFGITFLLLMAIWYWHYIFFRQYGLNNHSVVWVNGILLFLVLLFVYPLKFLATLVINHVLIEGVFGYDMPDMVFIQLDQLPYLHSLYAVGFSAVFICFAGLYKLALNSKEALKMTGLEELLTRHHLNSFLIVAAIPLFTIAIVFYPHSNSPMWAGMANSLIWPATWWYRHHAQKEIAAFKAREGEA